MGDQSTPGSQRSHLPELVQRMTEPSFYPHPTTDPITLIQTHISYVLLTGELVYKIKKPLHLDFLDFSTLEKRRHFCSEEIRLNRRGAPGIYLRVDEVRRHGNDFHIGGEGTIVEYLVVMRELPQEGLFNHLTERNALHPEHIVALAKTVAAYHASSPTDARVAQFGWPDCIRHVIEANYQATQQFIGGPQTQQQFQQTKSFTDRYFAEHRKLLEDRVEGGHIRECHGDLHLGNICLFGQSILLFDCIEFNESFRCIDVIQDAAFAAMDLQASGRDDLATLFINVYAEQTGDWEGLQLLRLYLCRHAYVRAKVNSMLLEEPEVDAGAKQVALTEATAYYRLAWQYALARKGRIILVSGLSGSGKSTLGRQLAQTTGALHIRSDAIRKHLAAVPLNRRGNESLYTQEMTDRTYHRLLELGLALAAYGFTVILDARFNRQRYRLDAIERARAAGVPVRILHCMANRQIMRDRLAARQNDVSDATADLLDRQEREFEHFSASEQTYLTSVDTTHPFDLTALRNQVTGD